MPKIHVTPKDGRRVLDPGQSPPTPLPAVGKIVERSSYWLRRAAAGEVTISPPPVPKPAAKGKGKEE